jgi:thiamine-phosphate pyrophosphorylase
MTTDICQLYLISPLEVGGDFPDRLRAAFEAGPVAAFQFRVKGLTQHEAADLGKPLREICAEHDVAFIVNRDISLAKRLNADGIHLSHSDGDPRETREILGQEIQIGVSCAGSRHAAMEAGDAGADYVSFGAFHPTTTKEVSEYADPELLTWWQGLFELPCVAVGGIKVENAAALVEAGADFLAVSSGVWAHPEGPAAAVKGFNAVFAAAKPRGTAE